MAMTVAISEVMNRNQFFSKILQVTDRQNILITVHALRVNKFSKGKSMLILLHQFHGPEIS